jgi:hypothetical protein
MPGKTFTGETLAQALESGEFEQPAAAGVVLTGMVKPSEQTGHVAFARGGCDTWVELPTSLIENAEHIGARPCEDHSHPVFRITLRESDDPQAKLLGQLLATHARATPRIPPPGRRLPPPRFGPASRAAGLGGIHDSCLWACDWLVRECVGFGGNYEECLSLRATCSDICGILSSLDPIFF